MPPLLIPLIAGVLPAIGPIALTGAGAGFAATTYTIATVLAYTLTTGATLGASLLLGQQKKPKGDPQQISVKQSLPPRMRSYGRVKIAGAYGFHETAAGNLYQIHIHGEGEWDAIEEWWLNDKNALVSVGVVGSLPWGSNVTVESHLGAASQAASPALLGAFPGIWTVDHKLNGLAYTVLRLGAVKEKFFSKVYPNGVPALRVVARTSKVYDPRTAAVAFSENPALCIRDYLTHSRGFNIPSSLIDDTSFAAFANLCDEAVPRAAGGTEPRYRISLTYDLTQQPSDVLRLLMQSCDAEIYPTAEGKIGIRGGAWTAPTVTLTADDILTYRYEAGNDKLAAFNLLKLTCKHPASDYQPVEIDPWEDLASQAEIGVLSQDLTLEQVPSWTQGRRLGKIFSAKGNPAHRLTLHTNFGAIRAFGERIIHVVVDELGIDHDFLIEKFEVAGDLSSCDITLASLSAAAYGWNPATEEGAAPVVPQDTSIPIPPPTPTDLSLTLQRTQVSLGVYASKVAGVVDAIPNSVWNTLGRYRRVGDTAWTDAIPDGNWGFLSETLDNDVVYEFQAAHAGWGGINSNNIGAWTASVQIEVISDPSRVNLLPHSDDPDGWASKASVTIGALVGDPLGGTRARSITFAADAGYVYGQAVISGALPGRTFTASAYLRAPSGKAKIVLAANATVTAAATEVDLTTAWQRVSMTVTAVAGTTGISIGIDNRAISGLTDTAAGVVEIFGGMVQERSSMTDYKSVP